MKKLVELNRKGFTLIEVIVVAAIIAILAGILVPMIFNQVDEAKKTRAQGDIKILQNAVATIKGNTQKSPTWSTDSGACLEDVDMLRGPGTAPGYLAAGGALPAGLTLNVSEVMGVAKGSATANCYRLPDGNDKWAGPYVGTDLGTDPWGNSYVLYVSGLKAAAPGPAWIVSAGPDGIINTDFANSTAVDTNDIGVKIQ